MKVLLISPPHQHMFSQGQPPYYAEEQALLPPLGLLCIAGYLLEAAPRHEVRVLDMPVLEMDQQGLGLFLQSFQPEVVGINCLTNLLCDTLETARTVKRTCPEVPVVLGGYHVQLFPLETLRKKEVDAAVLGAGEVPFKELLDGVEATGDIPRLPGVLTNAATLGEISQEIRTVEDPDRLPFPARHLTPYGRYYSATSIASPTTLAMTSFGCPFRCIFCNTSRIQKIVARSPHRVAEEFASCIDLGIREIAVLDENFTINRDRVMVLTEEIRRRGLDVLWSIKSRVDHVDAELLRALHGAGCYSIHFGVESGDEDILKRVRKDITPDQVHRAFRLCQDEGLQTTAAFMLGFPGETREQVQRTISFALELDPNYAQFSVAIPLPGTELYRMAFEQGLFLEDHWQAFAQDPTPSFRPPGWNAIFSAEELHDLLEEAYRRFYLRPRYIWRRIRRLHSLKELSRNMQIGFRFLLKR